MSRRKTSTASQEASSLQAVVRPLGECVERMTNSIYAIVALHAAEELSEGQCVKLMNITDRVSWRLAREKILAEMRDRLAKDMERHGWKWPNTQAEAPPPTATVPGRKDTE